MRPFSGAVSALWELSFHVSGLWYSVKIMPHFRIIQIPVLALSALCLVLFNAGTSAWAVPNEPEPRSTAADTTALPGCLTCHQTMQPGPNHAFVCSACHSGNTAEHTNKDAAHKGLISQPAHPQHMQTTCGRCHDKQVSSASHSLHFTLGSKINAVRAHFGLEGKLAQPTDIPVASSADAIQSKQMLVDDMLRRSCLRCHVYSKGDSYSAVRHGSGCAACHLTFSNGKAVDHTFRLPTDQQCLSCHYGNYAGSDYYGRYEHDLPYEYRTPYTADTETGFPERPYGVEYHDLAPDVHQQRGMVCLDCHQGFVHGKTTSVRCQTCHNWSPAAPAPALINVHAVKGQLILNGLQSSREHVVPQLRHPAHKEFGQQVDCQVCHAQWSYNDTTTHLLLSYNDDYDPWFWLTVQGSSEVEKQLEDGLHSYLAEGGPTMRDGLTGESRPGIWFKGYTERRWERMLIGKDASGMLRVLRPVLDLRLSMMSDAGEPLFDNLHGMDSGIRPYTPHTTGPAGLFYRDRLQGLSAP